MGGVSVFLRVLRVRIQPQERGFLGPQRRVRHPRAPGHTRFGFGLSAVRASNMGTRRHQSVGEKRIPRASAPDPIVL